MIVKKVKKIKNLTQDEVLSICSRNAWCERCPLHETLKCPNVDLNGEEEIEFGGEDNEKE